MKGVRGEPGSDAGPGDYGPRGDTGDPGYVGRIGVPGLKGQNVKHIILCKYYVENIGANGTVTSLRLSVISVQYLNQYFL